MSATRKARISGALIALLALWPLAHRQLVTRYDLNPWKLYGFAMYCTPHSVAVDLIDLGVEPAREIHREELPPSLREAYDRFVVQRHTLGALHPPGELGRRVLKGLPEVDDLTIAVTVTQLPFAGSELASRTRFYRFRAR